MTVPPSAAGAKSTLEKAAAEIDFRTGFTSYQNERCRMVENRASRRNKVLKKGRIIYNDGHSVVECLVKNISEYGAGLEVPEGFDCPNTFTLEVMGGEKREAEVVWQANAKVGLRLIDIVTEGLPKPMKAPENRASPLERINTIQAELDQLRREVEAMLG